MKWLIQILNNLFAPAAKSVLVSALKKPAEANAKDVDVEYEVFKLQKQVDTWHNRAFMAYEQRNPELSRQALERKFKHVCAIASLQGNDAPAKPEDPEELFGTIPPGSQPPPHSSSGPSPSAGPNNPTGVPRRPYPNTGDQGAALTEPTDDSESDRE